MTRYRCLKATGVVKKNLKIAPGNVLVTRRIDHIDQRILVPTFRNNLTIVLTIDLALVVTFYLSPNTFKQIRR
jgi:hypothetical protein